MCTGKLYSPLKIWRKGQHVHIKSRGIFVEVILIMNQNLESSFKPLSMVLKETVDVIFSS